MLTTRTSATHPIPVFFLPETLPEQGKIGITYAPGKQSWGMAGYSNRDLTSDLQRLRSVYQTDLLVSLIEEQEFAALKIPTLREQAEMVGMRSLWFPIPDFSVPTSLEQAVELVQKILAATAAGETVVLHCRGGLGRSGLIAAACLVALGKTPEQAIALTRQVRPGALETRSQVEFVSQFAQVWAHSAASNSSVTHSGPATVALSTSDELL